MGGFRDASNQPLFPNRDLRKRDDEIEKKDVGEDTGNVGISRGRDRGTRGSGLGCAIRETHGFLDFQNAETVTRVFDPEP